MEDESHGKTNQNSIHVSENYILYIFTNFGMVSLIDHSLCVCVSCSVMSDSLLPTNWSLLGSSVHGILQARILEGVAILFFKGSFWPRDQIRSPALQADSLLSELLGKPVDHSTKQYFISVLSCIFLTISEAEHLSMFLFSICMDSFVKWIFKTTFPIFLARLFSYYWNWIIFMYKKISPWCNYSLHIFPPNL